MTDISANDTGIGISIWFLSGYACLCPGTLRRRRSKRVLAQPKLGESWEAEAKNQHPSVRPHLKTQHQLECEPAHKAYTPTVGRTKYSMEWKETRRESTITHSALYGQSFHRTDGHRVFLHTYVMVWRPAQAAVQIRQWHPWQKRLRSPFTYIKCLAVLHRYGSVL